MQDLGTGTTGVVYRGTRAPTTTVIGASQKTRPDDSGLRCLAPHVIETFELRSDSNQGCTWGLR